MDSCTPLATRRLANERCVLSVEWLGEASAGDRDPHRDVRLLAIQRIGRVPFVKQTPALLQDSGAACATCRGVWGSDCARDYDQVSSIVADSGAGVCSDQPVKTGVTFFMPMASSANDPNPEAIALVCV